VSNLNNLEINPLSVLKNLILRQISNALDDPKLQNKLEKLKRTDKWDYNLTPESSKARNFIEAKVWDISRSRQYKHDIDLLIKQKLATSLCVQITQEIMWALLTETNKKLSVIADDSAENDVQRLVKENTQLANELSKKLETTADQSLINVLSELIYKSTELENISNSGNQSSDSIPTLGKSSSNIVLDIGDKNSQVSSEIKNLIRNFPKLDEGTENIVSNLNFNRKEIAHKTGLSLGFGLQETMVDIKNKIWEIAQRDTAFADGLGESLGLNFKSFNEEIQESILQMADSNPNFCNSLGNSLNHTYSRLKQAEQLKVIDLAKRNRLFARALGGSTLNYIEPMKSTVSSNKEIQILDLPFKSDIDIGFILKPEERPFAKVGTYRIEIQGKLKVPKMIVEVIETDIVSLQLDALSINLSLSNPMVGLLCETTITGTLPWKVKYDIISSVEGVKNTDLITRNRGEIRPTHTSKYLDNGYFECELYLDSRPEVLNDIEYVTYLLHPTFENPTYDTRDVKNGFPLRLTVWGEFRIHIKINYKDGEVNLLSHLLTLHPEPSTRIS
jgi:YEATS family